MKQKKILPALAGLKPSASKEDIFSAIFDATDNKDTMHYNIPSDSVTSQFEHSIFTHSLVDSADFNAFHIELFRIDSDVLPSFYEIKL